MEQRPYKSSYQKSTKEDEKEVKKWIKGEKDCDLVTDIVHAAGFEAEFVIVFGNRTSLSAASRATTKLAIVEFDKRIRKSINEADMVKKLEVLEPSEPESTGHYTYSSGDEEQSLWPY